MSTRAAGPVALLAAALWLGAVAPRAVSAQDSVATATPSARVVVIRRAQQLVNDGSGSEGRALMDSLLNATEPRSPDEAEVLYWRAMLAESWDQAQRDYLRVMLEHERSQFASTAMLRLAQGEAMRGDRDAALRYLERLLVEVPEAPERADALALRDRLTGVANTTAAPVMPTPVPPLPVTPAPVTPTPAAPSTPRPSAASGAMVWSVQVAAFPTAGEASAFAAELRSRGYDTRVDGSMAPFRVRFGRYPTRAAASAAMEAYKTKERGDAFLTQVPRP